MNSFAPAFFDSYLLIFVEFQDTTIIGISATNKKILLEFVDLRDRRYPVFSGHVDVR
jgi:hypothetical protein